MTDAEQQRERARERVALIGYTFVLALCFAMLATRVRPDDLSLPMVTLRILAAGGAASVGGRLLLVLRRHR